MSTLQTIDSKDFTIGSLLNDFYTVPSYQREYAWGSEPVEQLLSDIHDEFADNDSQNLTEYFIGSIVVFKKSDNTFELIDGQQRSATLFWTLGAVCDHTRGVGIALSEALTHQITSVRTDNLRHDLRRYHLSCNEKTGVLENLVVSRTALNTSLVNPCLVANILDCREI